MTAHELARELLAGPDVPVVVYGFSYESEKQEATGVVLDEARYMFDGKTFLLLE